MSERYLLFFTKEIVHHFDLNESKGVCNFGIGDSDEWYGKQKRGSVDAGGAQLTKNRYISTERSAPDTRAVTFRKNISRFPRLWSLESNRSECVCARHDRTVCVCSKYVRQILRGSGPRKDISRTYFEACFTCSKNGEWIVVEISKSILLSTKEFTAGSLSAMLLLVSRCGFSLFRPPLSRLVLPALH